MNSFNLSIYIFKVNDYFIMTIFRAKLLKLSLIRAELLKITLQ